MKIALYLGDLPKSKKKKFHRKQIYKFAQIRGWEIVQTYTQKRVSVKRILTDIQKKEFECVVVYELEDFGNSLSYIVNLIYNLSQVDIGVYSMSDHISTLEGVPFFDEVTTIITCLAKIDQNLARKEVRQKKLASSIELGRPAKVFDHSKALQLQHEGLTFRQIGKHMKVSASTVSRRLRELELIKTK